MCPEKWFELSIVPNYPGDELTIVDFIELIRLRSKQPEAIQLHSASYVEPITVHVKYTTDLLPYKAST